MALPKSSPFGEYLIDVAQRNILFCDLLRRRSEQYFAHKAQAFPHVLSFDAEQVLDARSFERPVNYLPASNTANIVSALARPKPKALPENVVQLAWISGRQHS